MERDYSYLRTGGVVLLLALAGTVCTPVVMGLVSEWRFRTACAEQLTQIGVAMNRYNENGLKQGYPVLSLQLGRLAPDLARDALPNIVSRWFDKNEEHREEFERKFRSPDWFLCPTQPAAVVSGTRRIDDWSYFYTGHWMGSDKDADAFFTYYTNHIEGDEVLLPSSGPDGWRRQWFMYDAELLPRTRLAKFLNRSSVPYDPETKTLAKSLLVARREAPVLIERPHNHSSPGGHVLYMDGHVEFIPYPGKWPMTEKTIGLLMELDALGE